MLNMVHHAYLVVLSVVAIVYTVASSSKAPNIVFVLLDDVGSNDLGYNSELSPIPTPNIDQLVRNPRTVHFSQYYVHSLCTPSRAALMTGRYHVNTGLTNVLVPGTPIGLPFNIPTMPESLKSLAGYSTAMVGKWHLGSAQHRQTPTGRGFDNFIGMYMWDCDYMTKMMYETPLEPFAIDWVDASSNGSWRHFAEPRHSTEAITDNAINFMKSHALNQIGQDKVHPLFLYVAFTAAHSPLQPMPQHEMKCSHIPHIWRRQFCGLVVGLDEAVANITNGIHQYLGENTVLVLSSDNGGSPWFGGMNEPLRGTKATPYEGGVRVPAFAVDFSDDLRYFGGFLDGNVGRRFEGLVHISDWLPTFLSLAGVQNESFPVGLDGMDISQHLRAHSHETVINSSPRNEVLLELVTANDAVLLHHDNFAYRIGDMKYVKGFPRDPHWYFEPRTNLLNSTEHSTLAYVGELVLRAAESIIGPGLMDTVRITMTHTAIHGWTAQHVREYDCPRYRADPLYGGERRYTFDCEVEKIFNLTADPQEKVNVIAQHSALADEFRARIAEFVRGRPYQPNLKMQYPLSRWSETFSKEGSCNMNNLIQPASLCRFVHPWIPDDVEDPEHYGDVDDSVRYTSNKINRVLKYVKMLLATALIGLFAVVLTGLNGPIIAEKNVNK